MLPWRNWIAHLTTNQKVGGSNPLGSTKNNIKLYEKPHHQFKSDSGLYSKIARLNFMVNCKFSKLLIMLSRLSKYDLTRVHFSTTYPVGSV